MQDDENTRGEEGRRNRKRVEDRSQEKADTEAERCMGDICGQVLLNLFKKQKGQTLPAEVQPVKD